MSEKQMKKEKGITLVALVVTIIILLILAGVTLNLALSDTGLFKVTQNVVDRYKSAQEEEEKMIADLEKDLDEYKSETQTPEEPPKDSTKGPNGKPLIPEVAKMTDHGTIEGEDKLGNPVTVPKDFKVVEGETVEDGIVIEDSEGNQFVWIPVSNTDGDNNISTQEEGSIQITKNDKSKVEITLGRYTFSSDGTPTPVQNGSQSSEDNDDYIINLIYKENTKIDRTNKGAGAKALDKFVESVEKNHGYYIGRYEASFASGDTPTGSYGSNGSGVTSIMTNQKPLVKLSKYKSDGSMNYTPETLWNCITQEDASKVCQNMYNEEDRDIESDLVNSYAWDTAIVYIEAMGHNNYANANRGTNTTLKNTGETGDEKCHIFDMAGNLYEWTTEYSTTTDNGFNGPCVLLGGGYYSSSPYTVYRYSYSTTIIWFDVGFRPLLYLK